MNSTKETFRCSDLQPGDIVVFHTPDYGCGEGTFDGNVIYVDHKQKTVAVCYLEGYKSRSENIPFGKMLAKHDPNGKEMLFGGWIRGRSILLTAE